MPSYGGAHGPDGSKKTGDQGQGTRDRDGGNTGGGKSVGDRKTMDSRARNPRYQQNTIATRPATLGNILGALRNMPGPGMVAKAVGMISGAYDPYDGPVGKTTGYRYDGADRVRFGWAQTKKSQVTSPAKSPTTTTIQSSNSTPNSNPSVLAPIQGMNNLSGVNSGSTIGFNPALMFAGQGLPKRKKVIG